MCTLVVPNNRTKKQGHISIQKVRSTACQDDKADSARHPECPENV